MEEAIQEECKAIRSAGTRLLAEWQLNRAWLVSLWYTYIGSNKKEKEAWPRFCPDR